MSSIERENESDLINGLRCKEEQALEKIIMRYTGYVSVIVKGIIGSSMTQDDLEETVSDVFFTLWKNSERVQQGKLRGYLGGIARSRGKNKLRELRETEELEEDFLELPDTGPEERLTREEERKALYAALGALNERDRDIFIRHYYYYQSAADIAKATGLKRETVKTILKSGRAKLKRELTEGGLFCEAENIGAV